MSDLLVFEFRKLKRQKSFYICTAIMLVLLIMMAVLTVSLQNITSEVMEEPSGDGIDISISVNGTETQSTYTVFDFMIGAVSITSFETVAGIFAVLFVCADYEQQTIKNILARGYSRSAVCISKFISVFATTAIMFAVTEVSAFVIGVICFDIGKVAAFKFFTVILTQYLSAMASVALAIFIAFRIRRNGGSIAGVILVPSIVELILALADSYLDLGKLSLSDLWLSSFISDLLSTSVEVKRMVVCAIASLIYIALFAFLSIRQSKKTEV